MSMKLMQIVISKADLDLVAARATLAAMSEEGQSELSRASNETRGCVRISAADGKITFESSVSRLSVRHIIPVGGDVAIVSEGETCIPAKDLKTVASKVKNGRKVSLTFSPIPPDPTLSILPAAKAITPNGVVEIGSINGDRIIAKTKVEAYPASAFAAPQYPEESDLTVLMAGKASSVRRPCGMVSFCINPSDQKEIYDKFAIFTASDSVWFLGSDGKRCAAVQGKADSFDRMLGAETKAPVLVDGVFMSPILASLSDDDPIVVGIDSDAQRFYIVSGQTTYCVNMIAEALRKKYPNYKRVVALEAGVVILVNRDELSESMDFLGNVNKERGRHTYSPTAVNINARGFLSIKEATGEVPCKLVGDQKMKGDTISLQTTYVVDGLKKMTSDNVRLAFTTDELRVRIEDEVDPKFSYFLQVMNPNEV